MLAFCQVNVLREYDDDDDDFCCFGCVTWSTLHSSNVNWYVFVVNNHPSQILSRLIQWFGGYRCPKMGFPIDFDSRPYNSVTHYRATLRFIYLSPRHTFS